MKLCAGANLLWVFPDFIQLAHHRRYIGADHLKQNLTVICDDLVSATKHHMEIYWELTAMCTITKEQGVSNGCPIAKSVAFQESKNLLTLILYTKLEFTKYNKIVLIPSLLRVFLSHKSSKMRMYNQIRKLRASGRVLIVSFS